MGGSTRTRFCRNSDRPRAGGVEKLTKLPQPPLEEQFSAKLLEANLFPIPLQAPIRPDARRNKIVQTNECRRRDSRRRDFPLRS